jgi:uncharacterized protein (TIGR03437 family)
MIESPVTSESLETPVIGLIGQTILPFLRTLAPLPARSAIVSLTTSGLTTLPWDYDALLAPPVLQGVANAADGSAAVAPGGLITVRGVNLAASPASSSELPVPTTLGESCLTVNGVLLPMFSASSGAISAQLPFDVVGAARLVLRTAGGTSNALELTIHPGAPAIFRDNAIAEIYRVANNRRVTLSNPIHPEDVLVILLTGLGNTSPSVEAGYPSPADPQARARLAPEVVLGDAPLEIYSAGLVPNEVGVYQIVGKVPYWAPEGLQVPLTIRQGTQSTTLQVRVVK